MEKHTYHYCEHTHANLDNKNEMSIKNTVTYINTALFKRTAHSKHRSTTRIQRKEKGQSRHNHSEKHK